MIAHIATFSWREGVTDADIDGLADELRTMAAGIPSIVFYRCGTSLRMRPNGADFAVIAVVADQSGLDAYLDSPAHVETVARSIAPHLGTRQAVQLDLDGADFPAEWRALS